MAIFGYDLFLSPRPELLINLDYVTFSNPEVMKMAGPYLGLFYFIPGFIWMSYVLQSFLDVLKTLGKYKDRVCSPSNGGYWKKWLIIHVVLFVMFSIWQIAYNPVALTIDSWGYLDGWLTGTYTAGRSPVYSFLIKIVLTLAPTKPEVLWIVIAQNLAFSSLLASLLMYIHKRWIRFRYIVAAAVILPLIPSFGLYTILVKAPLTNGMAILWFSYVLVRIIDEVILQKTTSKKQLLSFCIQLCISMVLTYFFRVNAFLVFIVMTPVLVILFSLKKQIGLLVSVVISVFIVLLILFPGYDALGAKDVGGRNQQHKYWAAMHDIQATYYGGGRLSDKTITALRKYIHGLDDPEMKSQFQPDFILLDGLAFDFRDLTVREFIPMYVDSFVRNPFKMGTSMLYRVRQYWVIDSKGQMGDINQIEIFDPSTFFNLTGSGGFDWSWSDPAISAGLDWSWSDLTESPELGVYRQPNILTNIMDLYILGMGLPVPSIFVWRFGIWTALMIISIMTLLLQKRHIWLITYMPVFVYLATLILSNGVTIYRYGLPVFYIGLFLPLTLFMHQNTNSDNEIEL